MKKIIITVGLLGMLSTSMFAQMDAARTNKTKLIDALAAMPAKDSPAYQLVMQDLVSTGAQGAAELAAQRMQASGEMLVKLDYALNSLTGFAAQLPDTAYQNRLQDIYQKAIQTAAKIETARFYMGLLKIAGTDYSVPFLKGYLADPQLCEYAAQTLSTIGSPLAGSALLEAYAVAPDKLKKHLIIALGEMQYAPAESALLTAYTSQGADNGAIAYALSRCGGEQSLNALKKAGAWEPARALAQRICENGGARITARTARELMKEANKTENTALRCAAFDLLVMSVPQDKSALILDALKENDREYRNHALRYADPAEDAKLTSALLKKLSKEKGDVLLDLLYWCGDRRLTDAVAVIEPLTKSSDAQLSELAIRTMGRIGGEEAIDKLGALLTDSLQEQIALTQDVLAYTHGSLGNSLMTKFAQANPEGKSAILTLIANQNDSNYVAHFFEMCSSADPQVRQTAISQLENVVTPTSLPRLFSMLRGSTPADLPAVQNAVIAAVRMMPQTERLNLIQTEMSQDDSKNRSRYYRVLTAAPSADAIAMICRGCESADSAEANAAQAALCEWNGAEAIDPLYALCEADTKSSSFNRLWDAYMDKTASARFAPEKKLIFLRKGLEIAQTPQQKQAALNAIKQTNSYLGIITAAPYLDDAATCETACQTIMQIALNNPDYAGGVVNDLLQRVMALLNNPDKGYQQQAIQKYLDENKGRAGFVALFNGKDLSGWQGLVGNPISRSRMSDAQLKKAQQKADEQMRNSWVAEDGILVFNGKGDNLCTQRPYGNFEMYVDWKLDENGSEPDAGIYLRGTPQVQIWDTARVNVGAQVGSGGLYNNQKNMSIPSQVSDNRVGEWNSFFIRMVGERVSVWLNGEQVVDNVILENYWDRAQPIPLLEQIELQAHGSKVYYRDIYLRELPATETYRLSDEEKKEGFEVLFDGATMFNWIGNTRDYVAEEGCIALYPQNGGGGNLYTKEEYGDFVLRFDFQLTPGANNGLGIRTPAEGDAAYVGMELQILDNEAPVYSTLEPYQYHGSVYGVIPAKRGFLKENGEWNTQEVVANGDQIKVVLNGEVILDGNIRDAAANGTMDKREHPGLFNKKGHIAFLGHGSPVKFRNIRVRRLEK